MLRIEELRKAAGLTSEELASRVGVSRIAVFKWEHNQAFPRADKLPKLAAALGVGVEDLYREVTT